MLKIKLRFKEIKSNGKGSITYRKVIHLEKRVSWWANDVAEEIEGDWYQGQFRAHERKCAQRGLLDEGTLILDIEKPTSGTTTYMIGRVVPNPDEPGMGRIAWIDHAHKKTKKTDAGWVHIIEIDGTRYEISG